MEVETSLFDTVLGYSGQTDQYIGALTVGKNKKYTFLTETQWAKESNVNAFRHSKGKHVFCVVASHLSQQCFSNVMKKALLGYLPSTSQPLYNTIVGVQANFHVSYPFRVITRVKCIDI